MGKVQEITPYLFVGGLLVWLGIYSCLSLHYTSSIASSHHKMSTELRKIRKEHAQKFHAYEQDGYSGDSSSSGIDELDKSQAFDLLSKLHNSTIN